MTIRHTPPDADSLAAEVVHRRIQADIAALSRRGHAQRMALADLLRAELEDLDLANGIPPSMETMLVGHQHSLAGYSSFGRGTEAATATETAAPAALRLAAERPSNTVASLLVGGVVHEGWEEVAERPSNTAERPSEATP